MLTIKGRAIVATLLATGLFAVTACASPSPSRSDTGAKHRIAMFYAQGNAYLTAGSDAAKARAKEAGAELTLFNAANPQEQLNQLETAVQQNRYDAFVIGVMDGNLLCDYVTGTIAKASKVITFQSPLCGRDTKSGDEMIEPGIITHVTGQDADFYAQWVDEIKAANPDGGQVAALSGPPLYSNTINFEVALERLGGAFTMVANQTTDYSTAVGASATQAIIQANPGVSIIVSNYSGITEGVMQTLADAGRHDIRVYDLGGDKWAASSVQDGSLEMTAALLPAKETTQALQAALDAIDGKSTQKVIKLYEDPSLPGTPFITKRDVADYTPEY